MENIAPKTFAQHCISRLYCCVFRGSFFRDVQDASKLTTRSNPVLSYTNLAKFNVLWNECPFCKAVLPANKFMLVFKCVLTKRSSVYDALSKMLSNDICLFRVQIVCLVTTALSNTPLTGHIKDRPAYLCIITHNLRLEDIKGRLQAIFPGLQKQGVSSSHSPGAPVWVQM